MKSVETSEVGNGSTLQRKDLGTCDTRCRMCQKKSGIASLLLSENEGHEATVNSLRCALIVKKTKHGTLCY